MQAKSKSLPKSACLTLMRLLKGRPIIWLTVGVCASVSLSIVEATVTVFLQLLIKKLGLINGDIHLWDKLDRWNPTVLELCGLLLAIGGVRSFGTFLMCHSAVVTNESINAKLRLTMLQELLGSGKTKLFSSSDVNLKISEVFPKAARFCEASAYMIVNSVITASMAALMFVYAWREALVGIFGLMLAGCLVIVINRRVNDAAKQIPASQQLLLTGIERIARNWLLVRILRTNESEHRKLIDSVLKYTAANFRASFFAYFGAAMPPFLGIVILVSILAFHFDQSRTNGVAFLSFLYLFVRFAQYVGNISNFFGTVVSTKTQFVDALKFYSRVDEASTQSAGQPLNLISTKGVFRKSHGTIVGQAASPTLDKAEALSPPSIELQHVHFSYTQDSKPVIVDLTFSVRSGEQFAIVGRSGSGKSTLLGLILGTLEPDLGSVQIDGVSSEAFFARSWGRIGYVGAEPFLIQGSIKDNLEYGLKHSVSEDDCWRALRQAHLEGDIKKLGQGLAYQISENGEGLSAGQKQRLSLARALLCGPMLLVLDEATANLDDQTEQEIAASILELKGQTTVIIVSHRPGILVHADQILVMESFQSDFPMKNQIVSGGMSARISKKEYSDTGVLAEGAPVFT